MNAVAIDHPSPAMVRIPSGEFLMGGLPEDKFITAVELPRHLVVIGSDFEMSRGMVTREEWRAVMGSLPPSTVEDDCPVVGVDFAGVLEFLDRLSNSSGSAYRLPSEAEWEYACRAGSGSIFPQGFNLASCDANFLYDERGQAIGVGMLTPAGRFPANEFGMFDMLGNACEWTADPWHAGYDGAPSDGQVWADGGKPGFRVIRGGGWDHLPRVLRSSWRDWAPESARWDNLGFRVVRDIWNSST